MLNPTEEAKFAELKDKCRELKVPAPPEIFISLQVHDHNGVLTFDDVQRGHSWLRNFYNWMLYAGAMGASPAATFGAGFACAKLTHATLYAWSTLGIASGGEGTGSANSAISGIVVGTGDTAFDIDQYELATLIASGNTAGTLYYQAGTKDAAIAYTAGTKTWSINYYRVFNNNSGGSITVKETGIKGNTGAYGPLLERSVLSPAVAVADAAQLTVTYTISMDFSAID